MGQRQKAYQQHDADEPDGEHNGHGNEAHHPIFNPTDRQPLRPGKVAVEGDVHDFPKKESKEHDQRDSQQSDGDQVALRDGQDVTEEIGGEVGRITGGEEDEDDILNLPIDQFEKLSKDLEFLKQMPSVDIRTEYEINGKRYNVFTNLKKMTAGQYIDFQTYQKDYQKNMKYILSIFLIPQGKEYGDYDIDEIAEEIYNNLSILHAHSITLFFSLQFRSLTKAIVIYLIKQMKKQMKKAKTKIMKIRIGRMIIQLKNYSQEIGVGYI